MHEAEGMTFAVLLGEALGLADVEALIYQPLDQVQAKPTNPLDIHVTRPS